MSASLLALASAALVPLAQPAPERAGGQALLAACMGKEDFADPAPPARIYGNVWYVGTCTVSAILITSPKGHVLIDSGVEAAAPSVLANIARLGFRASDVKWLVAGHEHFDHTGALAALKAATGAKVALSAPAAHVMATGKPDPADSQFSALKAMTPVRTDRIIGEGSVIALGPIRLTATLTPGHTAGSTSWSWTSCANGQCRRFTYLDSLSALEEGKYRFAQHPEWVATFHRTLDRVAGMDCGVMLNPHPAAGSLFERMAGIEAFAAADDCSRLAHQARKRLYALATGKKP
jgi:metallo-beta-lactamase class B